MSWENWFRGHFLNPRILSSVPSERDLGRRVRREAALVDRGIPFGTGELPGKNNRLCLGT